MQPGPWHGLPWGQRTPKAQLWPCIRRPKQLAAGRLQAADKGGRNGAASGNAPRSVRADELQCRSAVTAQATWGREDGLAGQMAEPARAALPLRVNDLTSEAKNPSIHSSRLSAELDLLAPISSVERQAAHRLLLRTGGTSVLRPPKGTVRWVGKDGCKFYLLGCNQAADMGASHGGCRAPRTAMVACMAGAKKCAWPRGAACLPVPAPMQRRMAPIRLSQAGHVTRGPIGWHC